MYDEAIAFLIIAFVMAFLGVIFYFIAFYNIKISSDERDKYYSVTSGFITEWVCHTDSRGKEVGGWFPVYEYDVDGCHFRIEDKYGTDRPNNRVPIPVTIHYNPANPDDSYRGSTIDRQYTVLLMIFKVCGIIFIVAAVLFLLVAIFKFIFI